MKQETKSTSNKPPDPAKEQSAAFDKAMALFQKRDFARARELFAQAQAGPQVELAHSAQMYARMCERRLGQGTATLKSPEDYYTLGVTLFNRGDLEGAESALRKALELAPRADHVHYAMALCAGHRGNIQAAASHLQRAIELQPSNRIAARNDAEFHTIAQHAAIRDLLNGGGGERSNAG